MMLARLMSVCAVCIVCVTAATLKAGAQAQPGYSTSETAQKILADGFPAETHHVITYDGYILEVHRIPHGRSEGNNPSDRPVVFLMHGLLSASDAFIGLGPSYSLAYNLADAGFDVWMGNARGNRYSRHHIYLNPDDDIQKYPFFDFTFEEIGLYDLPSMMDYALEQTGNHQLHYIGHSQGGTAFLVLTTLRPDYNVKIASAHLLAGVGYQQYFPDEALAASAANVDNIYSSALDNGIVELYPEFLNPSRSGQISDYCTGNLQQKHMCDLFEVRRILTNQSSITTNENVPPGASLKQAAHYGQNIRDKLFRRYHYGTADNMKNYGLEEPPYYEMKLITCHVTMHYSMNDNMLDERDALAMVADMPNAKACRVARESFQHSDYIASQDAKALVTDYIIEAMKNTQILELESNTDVDEVMVTENVNFSGDTTTASESSTVEPEQSSTVEPEQSSTVELEQSSTVEPEQTSTEAIISITIATPGSAHSTELNIYFILLSSIILIMKQ